MKMNELKPKLFDVLKDYSKEQAMRDVISGIIVAIIALPLSIALAIASGVGPEQGLYTAIIAGFFISFFGGSRVQIGGPTAAFVVIIYGIVTDYGTAGLTVATILAGIFLIVMGICHFGSLIKYIPYTITTGFTCGIAVTLFVGQLKDFFGLSIASVPPGSWIRSLPTPQIFPPSTGLPPLWALQLLSSCCSGRKSPTRFRDL